MIRTIFVAALLGVAIACAADVPQPPAPESAPAPQATPTPNDGETMVYMTRSDFIKVFKALVDAKHDLREANQKLGRMKALRSQDAQCL